jgi:glutathione S-transferase
MLAPRSLRDIHPLGKAPVVDDDGVVIAETGAIVEYLVEKAGGRLGPAANRDSVLRYRHFLHYAEGSMMPPLLAMLVVGRLGLLGRPARAPLQRMFDVHLDWLETELGDRPWFSGEDFTAADVMMSFPLEAARARAGLDGGRPNLTDWLERIHARPAYGEALAKGGPYAYA